MKEGSAPRPFLKEDERKKSVGQDLMRIESDARCGTIQFDPLFMKIKRIHGQIIGYLLLWMVWSYRARVVL